MTWRRRRALLAAWTAIRGDLCLGWYKPYQFPTDLSLDYGHHAVAAGSGRAGAGGLNFERQGGVSAARRLEPAILF